MKLEFSRPMFEKHSNTEFHENPSSGSRVVPFGRTYVRTDRQTDGQTNRRTDRQTGRRKGVTKLIIAFRNFANAPKNIVCLLKWSYFVCLVQNSVRTVPHTEQTPVTPIQTNHFVLLKGKSSPVTGLEWPRGLQEVKVPRFHDNGTGWW